MNIKKFPNPKLNLPKELRDSRNKTTTTSFDAVENYLNSVGKYIYTNINLDYQRSDPNHNHAWIQRIVSANILRSLYLRNAFVEAFNARNTVAIFLPLKAWFETVGVLASILDLLESNLSVDELFIKLKPYALGNKGKGSLRVGTTEAINVLSMIEKADKYMEKMVKETSKDQTKDAEAKKYFTDFYDVASNPSHPSFDAYEVVSSLEDDGIVQAKTPDQIKDDLIETLPGYGGLLIAPICVENICQKIMKIEEKPFDSLGSKKYFDDQEPIKKEVGGMKLPGGFAIGPMFFSKNGKTASTIMGPAINAFDFGTANSLNLLNKTTIAVDEFQQSFNSEIEGLVAEILIYFQNRLKVITKTNVGQFNSIEKSIKEYARYGIDLDKLCDTNFLLALDSVRGRKHHSDRRYDADYSIGDVAYDTIEKLRELNRAVHKEIHAVNDALAKSHKDYDVKITQTPNSTSVSFTAEDHAFDLTRGAKIVPKKSDK